MRRLGVIWFVEVMNMHGIVNTHLFLFYQPFITLCVCFVKDFDVNNPNKDEKYGGRRNAANTLSSFKGIKL